MIFVNWSNLPLELLVQIVENHLPVMNDVIMFSSVCNSWNQAACACDESKLRDNWSRQMPWLMLTDGNDNDPYPDYEQKQMQGEVIRIDWTNIIENDFSWGFNRGDKNPMQNALYDDKRALLNLSNGRNNKSSYRLSLPETYGKACWGSRCGWIVTLGLDFQMHMFNPITKSQLPLPPQTTFRYAWKSARAKTIRAMFFCKVVVFRLPDDHNNNNNNNNNNNRWLVVAIQNGNSHVSIARPGDASWTHIHYSNNYNNNGPSIMDVIYCNKMKSLVFIDQMASLFYYDINNTNQQPQQELKPSLEGRHSIEGIFFPLKEVDTHIYLVQSGDDLLAIVRFIRPMFWQTSHVKCVHINCHEYDNFRVFRFRSATTTRGWEELENGIGNVAVFLGGNETICVDASVGGCRRNCIYFCDVHRHSYRNLYKSSWEYMGGSSHSGVFNLTTNKIEPINYDWKIRESPYCAPFWFTPPVLY